jgi:hypothetical protein
MQVSADSLLQARQGTPNGMLITITCVGFDVSSAMRQGPGVFGAQAQVATVTDMWL